MILLRKVDVQALSSDQITLEIVSSFCRVGVALNVYTSLCAVFWLLADRLLGNLTELILSFWCFSLLIFIKTSVFSNSNRLLSSASFILPSSSFSPSLPSTSARARDRGRLGFYPTYFLPTSIRASYI